MRQRLIASWRLLCHLVAATSPRQRRAFAFALTVLTSAVWAVGSAPPVPVPAPPPEPVSQQVVTEIQAGRPAGFTVGGLDISSHDHRYFTVHWPTEMAAGSRFVYVGAYVYARPDLGDPIGQAEHFLRHARFTRDPKTLVPFVDLEWPYGGIRTDDCYNLNPEQLRAWIRAFITRIETHIGRKPMIYTNTYWWNPCTGNDTSYGDHPLDIANYTGRQPRLPAGWSTFALWQYMPGDPKKLHSHDRDVVNGGLAGLKALTWPPPSVRR
jgi:Glycosyl hydrolases family 25